MESEKRGMGAPPLVFWSAVATTEKVPPFPQTLNSVQKYFYSAPTMATCCAETDQTASLLNQNGHL